MKILYTLVFSLVISGICAQITVTNQMFPTAGDELHYQTTFELEGFTISEAGADQTWDFTQLTIQGNDTMRFLSPAAGANAASFPNADMMVNMMGAELYARTLVNRIEFIGFAGADPLGTGFLDSINVKIDPPLRLFEAPLAFNQTSTHNAEVKITFGGIPEFEGLEVDIDSVRLKLITNRDDIVDAWGVLQINSGAHGALRQKQTTITSTQIELLVQLLPPPFPAVWVDPSQFGIDLGLPSDTSVTYFFFADGVVGPVAIVETNDDGATQVQQRSGDNIVALNSPLDQLNFKIYPNPAVNVVFIEAPVNPGSEYSINLININGQLLYSQVLSGNDRVNLENFSRGIYLLQILENGKKLGAKSLIIQ